MPDRTAETYYRLGVRDAFARCCALARGQGANAAVLVIARGLLETDPQGCNPHAKWIVAQAERTKPNAASP